MNNLFTKPSIRKKVFIIFTLIFILFFAIWLIAQICFFEKYYIMYKSKILKNVTDSFCDEYISLDKTEDINKAIVEHSNESGAYYVIMGDRGNLRYIVSYELEIELKDGSRLRFNLDNALHSTAFLNDPPKIGDTVNVEYSYLKNDNTSNVFFPLLIEYNGNTWVTDYTGYHISLHKSNAFTTEKVMGKVININIPGKNNPSFALQQNDAISITMDIAGRLSKREIKTTNKTACYMINPSGSNDSYSVAIKKVLKNSKTEYVCAVMSTKSISDAAVVVKQYTWVLFILLFIIMCTCAFIFSKLLTKPLIEITNVTKKVKNLDFSQKCATNSKDELGELAVNVNEMSQKLSETIDNLKHSNKKLIGDIERERLIEKKRREFVSDISHELKTPIAIIRAYSEGLIDGVSEAKKEHYLNVIVENTEKMDKLILDMLKDSALESGALKLDFCETDMCEFVKEVTNNFIAPCNVKNITLITDITDKKLVRNIDVDYMEQVLNNFITNAIKHTENGKIIVGVDEEKVWVENEGVHIPEDMLERIWDKFFKVEKSRDRSDKGIGLGLSIAKNILKLHDLECGVMNTSMGVKFWFSMNPSVASEDENDIEY